MTTINKKLVFFENKKDFEERNLAGDILDTSIVFVKDSNEIYTHGTEYQWVKWSTLELDVPNGFNLVKTDDGILRSANGRIILVKD